MKLEQFKILIRYFIELVFFIKMLYLFIHLHLFTYFWHYKSHKKVVKIILERKYSKKTNGIEKMFHDTSQK